MISSSAWDRTSAGPPFHPCIWAPKATSTATRSMESPAAWAGVGHANSKLASSTHWWSEAVSGEQAMHSSRANGAPQTVQHAVSAVSHDALQGRLPPSAPASALSLSLSLINTTTSPSSVRIVEAGGCKFWKCTSCVCKKAQAGSLHSPCASDRMRHSSGVVHTGWDRRHVYGTKSTLWYKCIMPGGVPL